MGSFSEIQRAIVYVRVSTKEQVEDGNSLATQERLCREYAKRNGILIDETGVFRELGESAKTTLRTELQKMIQYATFQKDKIDCLLIYKIDRLSRDTRAYGDLKVFFNSLGIKVISITENLEDNPIGRFLENTLAGVAQLDNEMRAERSKNGMIDAVREGRWVWPAPIGYVNSRVAGRRNIKPNHENNTALLLKEAWELVDSGYIIETARKMLTAKGLQMPNGKPISRTRFHKIFREPIYKGVITKFGLTIISPTIEPIVEADLFDRVLAKLTGKQKTPERYQKANPQFPLRGAVYCISGHRMTASSPRGNGGQYPKYHCAQCRGKGTSHKKDTLEERFALLLNSYEYQDAMKEALVVAIQENWEAEQQINRKQLNQLKKRLLELDALDDEIAKKSLKGVFTDEHARKLLAQNNAERIQIKLEIGQYEYLDQDLEEIIENGADALTRIGSIWSGLEDIHVKQRFQKWLFPVGVTWNGEEFGTTQIPVCISVKQQFVTQNSQVVARRGVEPLLPP